jgi:tetrahydromethanopterin S-methyltransferase subunit B
MSLDIWYGTISLISSCILGWAAYRFYSGPALITLGGRESQHMRSVQRTLLKQYNVAFGLVVGSGIIALCFLASGLYLLWSENSQMAFAVKALGVVCGLGDSALFAYFVKVWRMAGRSLGVVANSESPL